MRGRVISTNWRERRAGQREVGALNVASIVCSITNDIHIWIHRVYEGLPCHEPCSGSVHAATPVNAHLCPAWCTPLPPAEPCVGKGGEG